MYKKYLIIFLILIIFFIIFKLYFLRESFNGNCNLNSYSKNIVSKTNTSLNRYSEDYYNNDNDKDYLIINKKMLDKNTNANTKKNNNNIDKKNKQLNTSIPYDAVPIPSNCKIPNPKDYNYLNTFNDYSYPVNYENISNNILNDLTINQIKDILEKIKKENQNNLDLKNFIYLKKNEYVNYDENKLLKILNFIVSEINKKAKPLLNNIFYNILNNTIIKIKKYKNYNLIIGKLSIYRDRKSTAKLIYYEAIIINGEVKFNNLKYFGSIVEDKFITSMPYTDNNYLYVSNNPMDNYYPNILLSYKETNDLVSQHKNNKNPLDIGYNVKI
jgi:hypothetical protein